MKSSNLSLRCGIVPLRLGEGTHDGGVSIDVGWVETQRLNVLLYQLVKQLCTRVPIPELHPPSVSFLSET